MNVTQRKNWNTGLVAILALLYAWIGLAAHGLDRVLGLTGAVLILIALALMARSRTITLVLLVMGALPLAIHTWWSVITPLLAVLVIALGWFAVRASGPRASHSFPTTVPGARSPEAGVEGA